MPVQYRMCEVGRGWSMASRKFLSLVDSEFFLFPYLVLAPLTIIELEIKGNVWTLIIVIFWTTTRDVLLFNKYREPRVLNKAYCKSRRISPFFLVFRTMNFWEAFDGRLTSRLGNVSSVTLHVRKILWILSSFNNICVTLTSYSTTLSS